MAGKGDKRRPGDDARFRKNWERVFSHHEEHEGSEEEAGMLNDECRVKNVEVKEEGKSDEFADI